MSPITTHVLDTMSGKPAANLKIELSQQMPNNEFGVIQSGITNSDGRIVDLLQPGTLKPGTYKMKFEVEMYLREKGIECFYPFVEICFHITSLDQHYHIPLLLSPYGYSTYRGS